MAVANIDMVVEQVSVSGCVVWIYGGYYGKEWMEKGKWERVDEKGWMGKGGWERANGKGWMRKGG